MAKVTVTICDICKERIATGTCPMCGKDLCKPCSKTLTMELGIKFGPVVEIVKETICDSCFRTLETGYKDIITEVAKYVQPQIPTVLKTHSAHPPAK